MSAIFSTAYFPPIAYVAALSRHTDVLIEVKETFPKQTYRNRTVIMTANGVKSLAVPVIRNNHSRTDEVLIDYRDRWAVIHMRTLTAAYAASPYFMYYRDDIEAMLTRRYDRLVDLNQEILLWLQKKLKQESSITFTTDWTPAEECRIDDYRNVFSPKVPYDKGSMPEYYQVFSDRQPFTPNLSILDLLFNLGPEAKGYIESFT